MSYYKKEPWVKDIKKCSDPEKIAELIQKRIASPNIHGPYISTYHNLSANTKQEFSTDIIDELIGESDDFKAKTIPALGLLIHNSIENKGISSENIVLGGVFTIIKNAKLKQLAHLTSKWLRKNHSKLPIKYEYNRLSEAYRNGLLAYALIQEKSTATELWWLSLWLAENSYFWDAAFYGLRKQNTISCIPEIPLLMKRKIYDTQTLLVGIYNDVGSRKQLQEKLLSGLWESPSWNAGVALNLILDDLNTEEKNKMLSEISKIA